MKNQSAIGRASVAIVGVLLLGAIWLTAGAGEAAASVTKQGYIPLADGTQLEYTVILPAATGRFPVALQYAGYCEGTTPVCNAPDSTPALEAAGYAVLGVSIRGTSCSSGTFDAFTPQEWRDGAAAVEWAAGQSWSDGRVGMYGDSFPGITQVGVAGLRPPHLVAIAPFQVTTDMYRDVAAPGGMLNVGFGAFWAGIDQPSNSYESGIEQALQTGDIACAQALAHDVTELPLENVSLQALQHPYFDAFWQAHTPGADADRIDIPTFGCLTWQDDEVSSRGSGYLSELDPARTWVLASNGYHGQCEENSPAVIDELIRFFNRFVRGERNGFESSTPHVQLWHDTTADSAGHNVPGWITTFKSLASIPVKPLALYFRPNGEMLLTKPTGRAVASTRYAYPGPSLGSENGIVFGEHGLLWKGEEPVGASVSYTTPPLSSDTEFFGSGSANIWLSSTAPDTDLQITLTEVRPDGQEVYVARGWLAASHRALDTKRSTVLAPWHLDTRAAAENLTPGKPTLLRVQLDPFDYVFRKGSSLRVWIDAPTGETGGWSLEFDPEVAVNRIFADARDPSALVLGHLTGGRAQAAAPTCDTLLNQPCRRNLVEPPPGTIAIR